MPLRPLHPLLAAKAREELNEDPNRIEEHLRTIKHWLSQQPHLNARTDDQWLIAFLRGCKYNLEKTKTKLDLFYTLKTTAPNVYCVHYSDPKIFKILETGAVLALPKTKGPADPRVVMLRLGRFNTSEFTFMEVMAIILFQLHISYMEDDNLTVAGMVSVVDMKGASMGLMTQISLWHLKKLVAATQDAAPARVKGVHILTMPFIFVALLNIAKTFLHEKTRKRLNLYNKDFDGLYNHVPKEILPEEYGGNGGSLREIIDYWKAKFIKYNSWLEEDSKYKTDESKRLGKAKTKIEDMD